MNRALFPIVAAMGLSALALALAGCGGAPQPLEPPKREATDTGYAPPPAVTGLRLEGGRVLLSGEAAPNAKIRLATPRGQATEAQADDKGHWRLAAPASTAPAIYGLSQNIAGRSIQSEGYLLLTPDGQGVLLRAGAGALALGAEPAEGLTCFDIDRDGGAVVSGRGPAGSTVSARVDGRKLGEGRVDAHGRFALPLSGPVPPGRHSLKIFGDTIDQTLALDVTAAAPPENGPFRATVTPAGLRVDWMTPGGGLQTTLVARPTPVPGDAPRRELP